MPIGIKPAPLNDSGVNKPIPDVHANVWSKTTFGWCWPLLKIGYSRPLEKEDLWELDVARQASTIGLELEKNFYDRVPLQRRPRHLRPSSTSTSGEKVDITTSRTKSKEEVPDDDATLPTPVTQTKSRQKKEATKIKDAGLTDEERKKKYPGNADGGKVLGDDGIAYDQSLVWALSKTFFWPFYSSDFPTHFPKAAVFLVFSSLLQTFSPMVTKKLLSFITTSYAYSKATAAERVAGNLAAPGSISHGVGYAVGLFVMQEAASLFQNQYMQLGMSVGMLMRSSIIANISRKSLRLSGAARVKHPNGHLITLVSSGAYLTSTGDSLTVANSDISRLRLRRCFSVWVQPLQIIIGVILLLVYLGYSALVGVAILVFNTPIQAMFVRTMMRSRQAQLKKVDQRVRLIQEVLNGIRVVKLYAYETFFKDAPTIFASLQLFNVIRQPLMMLPMALTVSSDAYVALQRVTRALLAEELDDEMQVDLNAPDAIRATGDFAWETAGPQESMMAAGKGAFGDRSDKAADKKKAKEAAKNKKKGVVEPEVEQVNEKAPFELSGIDITIPRGALVCVVGSVGSGKSSLLQALIGEMRKVDAEVTFGGSTAYFAQSPWVQNATLRDNILFGRQYDEKRFEEIISACALEPDIEILPYGLNTEIGEKGINLSGGQKARVSLARATYFDADIVLLDDPLSAVDAHVAHHIVTNCITSGPLAAKTRILVTHHLEALPHADHIIMMDSGRIVEQGVYQDLIKNGEAFSRLIAEFGSSSKKVEETEETLEELVADVAEDKGFAEKKPRAEVGTGAKLMVDEERETGSISWSVYAHYFRSMGSIWWGPILFFLYGMAQVCTVGNSVFLGFWSAQSITGFSQGEYMGIYAAFGVASGLFTFAGTFAMYLRGISASYALFNEALGGVMRSKVSFTQVFSQLVTVFATVEQDMNTAERVSHYSHLPEEGALSTSNDPPESWPEEGCLTFTDVKMRYREGLPEVLRGVSFKTRPGETVGIVGRTGAGKSSLLQALFRICELSEGKIEIDGRDISSMGLEVLRKRLSVIPQDALLYAGSVRQNLDPTGEKDDASLNDALRRAGLVAANDATEDVKTRFSKFKLDADVTDEGSNFSAGERQLVALCRALVKNSRIIVLDEATSSVDVETDATVQRAIQVEFKDQSMLCIAHRLATIAFYDRVIVMDQGRVEELDTPLALFDRTNSIFRGMCDKAHLTRDDIVRIRKGAGKED
ncbi:hypothetical protein P7C70_g3660, partial [Phenoliferia sp. Uapishka_3]